LLRGELVALEVKITAEEKYCFIAVRAVGCTDR